MLKFAELVEIEKQNARKKNIVQVRQEIDSTWVQEKIDNFNQRYGQIFSFENIRHEILTNDIVAACFAKDPGKQNISEKLAADMLHWDLLPQSGKNAVRFTKEGDMVATKTLGGGKCADFFEHGVYITQKYTGNNEGGAQDNQMDDVITFLLNASKQYKCGACVDGWYWDEAGHKQQLITMFKDNSNVIIFGVDDALEGRVNFA